MGRGMPSVAAIKDHREREGWRWMVKCMKLKEEEYLRVVKCCCSVSLVQEWIGIYSGGEVRLVGEGLRQRSMVRVSGDGGVFNVFYWALAGKEGGSFQFPLVSFGRRKGSWWG